MRTSMPAFLVAALIALCATGASAQQLSDLSLCSDQSPIYSNQSPVPSRHKAESDEGRNALYVELGGPALLYSINFDRYLTPHVALRAGFGYYGFGVTDATNSDGTTSGVSAALLMIPITASFFPFSDDLNPPNSKLEVGGGLVYANVSGDVFGGKISASGVYFTAHIGYRYQPADGGFLFRATFTPLFGSVGFLPWAGLSAGYSW